jgi:hypothetical protein
MSIKREELNQYYLKLNTLVDEYIDKWKIRPKQLKRYLKPGSKNFNRFLERNGLGDIHLTRQVLIDILEDRCSVENDGVITFEYFSLFESDAFKIDEKKQCLHKGVEKASLSHEKALADYFDTNLGSINVEDSEKHIFSVDEWTGNSRKIIVYNSADIQVIKENFIQYAVDQFFNKNIDLLNNVSVSVSELVDKGEVIEKVEEKFTEDVIRGLINSCLQNMKYIGSKEHSGSEYHIWSE